MVGFIPLKIYHVCDCCDKIYKVTEINIRGDAGAGLTEKAPEDIMINEPENGNVFTTGLCDECRDEMYGPAGGFVQPYRLQ